MAREQLVYYYVDMRQLGEREALGLEQHRQQVLLLFAAPSKAAAARAFGISPRVARDFMGDTGNKRQIALALAHPGKVVVQPLNFAGDAFALRDPKQG